MSKEENKIINYLKELSKYELFLDNIFIKDKTARQILVSAYNKLKRQQKEIEGKNAVIDTYKHSEKVLTEQIDEQEKEIEERDKYNITTLPFEELKEMIEQNKNISIFGKEYISKDKIREKIKEYKEKYNNYPNYTPEDFGFRQEYLHKFRVLEELLEEK